MTAEQDSFGSQVSGQVHGPRISGELSPGLGWSQVCLWPGILSSGAQLMLGIMLMVGAAL